MGAEGLTSSVVRRRVRHRRAVRRRHHHRHAAGVHHHHRRHPADRRGHRDLRRGLHLDRRYADARRLQPEARLRD